MGDDKGFRAWADSFFMHLFSSCPVDATFAGLSEYSDRLPDASPSGIEGTIAGIEGLLAAGKRFDTARLDRFEAMDRDLILGHLATRHRELVSGRLFDVNPVTYTSEAVFSLLSLFVSDFRPADEKTGCFESRLAGIPPFFDEAKRNLRGAPPSWTERAVVECSGGTEFLLHGLPVLAEEQGFSPEPRLVQEAAEAFASFRRFLTTDLAGRPAEAESCGEETFRDILRQCHQTGVDPLEYADHAEELVAGVDAELLAGAAAFGAATPGEAIARLSGIHPEADTYLDTYRRLLEESRALAERERLLTWPKAPIEYRPVPRWARGVQPLVYFLFYRCPPRYAVPQTYIYHVVPVDGDLDGDERRRRLEGNSTFVIKTNHVLHHGGIGHHVQNWNARRARSRVGQIAGTDGSARLTMLCAGTLCEGWACYITGEAGNRGFLTPLESYAERASLRRMAARAVVDARLHCGVYSLDDAIRYYREKAGMSESFARSEAVKNSLFPGGAMMYLYGMEGIQSLRREMRSIRGDAFSLSEFHDELLSYGAVPVERIAAEMRRRT